LDGSGIRVLQNPAVKPPYYHVFESREREAARSYAGVIFMGTSTGSFTPQVFYYTTLLGGIDGTVYHVYRQNQFRGDETGVFLEVYDASGRLRLHQDIRDLITVKGARSCTASHIDTHRRLYVLCHFDGRDPEIR